MLIKNFGENLVFIGRNLKKKPGIVLMPGQDLLMIDYDYDPDIIYFLLCEGINNFLPSTA